MKNNFDYYIGIDWSGAKGLSHKGIAVAISSNKNNNEGYWRLYSKDNPNEDGDQVKAVSGICFTFATLFVLGTYSCLF